MTVQLSHLDYLKLFDWVWSTSAKVSILIVLLLTIKFVFKNKIGARLHYLLWSVVIISLILPWTPQSSLSLYNLTSPSMQESSVIFEDVNNSLISNITVNGTSSEVEANAPEPIASAQSPSLLPNTQKSIAISPFIHKLLFFIWMMGIISFITVTIGVNRRFALRIQGQPVVDIKLLTAYKRAKDNLNVKKEIPLIQTEHVASPSLYGLFHPRLLMPAGILEEFNPEQLAHVFLHELSHFKRKDLWVNWIIQGLLTVHWFNPVVWYAFLKLSEDQEMACDAVTLEHIGTNDAKKYAYTLITLLEKNSDGPKIASLASLSGTQSQIGRRIAMIKGFHKTSIKWSLLIIALVVTLTFVTLSNAKASISSTNETVAPVTNVALENNSKTVKIEPNTLISNEGWSLSISKVESLGGAQGGWGYHSPFKESDTVRNYAVFFTMENAEGKDKAFLPKGKVLGIVGTSGKYYDFSKGGYDSLDKWYSGEHWDSIGEPNSPGHWDSMGKPHSPGVFQFGTGADVDLNEQGITKVVYQDENGTKYEIPFKGTITAFSNPIDITSKKVAKLYGESNPKIVKVNRIQVESTNALGDIVFLEGNFSKDGKEASTLEFSMLSDGTKVWALRGYNGDSGQDIWLDNQVSI